MIIFDNTAEMLYVQVHNYNCKKYYSFIHIQVAIIERNYSFLLTQPHIFFLNFRTKYGTSHFSQTLLLVPTLQVCSKAQKKLGEVS